MSNTVQSQKTKATPPLPALDKSPRPAPVRRRILGRLLARLSFHTLVLMAVPLLVLFLWLRFLGLPPSVKDYLMAEIERRHVFPFPVSVDRFLLGATGSIIADNVTVYRDTDRQSVLLKVDRVKVRVAWLSWWRGGGLVEGASISNADVRYPIGPEETADFQQVEGDVAFNGRDIKIENARARFLSLALSIRGTIHNDGFPKKKPMTPEELQEQILAREAIFRSVRKVSDDIGGPEPINVELEFETATHDLAGGRANFILGGQDLTWRSAPVEEVSLHGSLADGVVDLSDLKIGLERGELTAYGEWNLEEHSAELQFTSSLDFTTLAPAFPGPLGNALGKLDFPNGSPEMNGRVLFDLRQGLQADVQADLDWRDFIFNGVDFSRLSVPLAYNGHQLLIPGLKITGAAGDVDLEFFFDSTQSPPSLKGQVVSSLDPTVLQGVFGEGMDRFLGSCAFHQGGPKIEASATGTALKTDAWKITGKLAASAFVYKNVPLDSATSDFTFADSQLDLPNLEVKRPEGKATGGIVYDFKNRAVELHHLVTQVNVAEVAPIMGPKFTEYTLPYHFQKPPIVHADGKVDLASEKKDLDTDLTVQVEGRSPMEWTLFHIPYTFDEPNGLLLFKDRRLTVNMKQCGFYDGSLAGVIDMDLRQSPAAYTLDLNLSKVNFKKFMVRTFDYAKSTGELTVTSHFTGVIGAMQTLDGKGEVKIENGDIAQIPFLGSLTPLLPLLSAADAAHSDFTAAKGVIHTDDLHISSETLALIGNGDYNFMKDQADLNMRVNANGPAAILLYPFSKIFEYHGTGPMKNVTWTPKNL
jgi:AsmA-like protein